MAAAGWKQTLSVETGESVDYDFDDEEVDLETAARDQLAKLIIRKFKGHGLERLVEGVLKAQGYTTYRSPMGPDKGVDLLAAPGPLGFGHPGICVNTVCSDRIRSSRPTSTRSIRCRRAIEWLGLDACKPKSSRSYPPVRR